MKYTMYVKTVDITNVVKVAPKFIKNLDTKVLGNTDYSSITFNYDTSTNYNELVEVVEFYGKYHKPEYLGEQVIERGEKTFNMLVERFTDFLADYQSDDTFKAATDEMNALSEHEKSIDDMKKIITNINSVDDDTFVNNLKDQVLQYNVKFMELEVEKKELLKKLKELPDNYQVTHSGTIDVTPIPRILALAPLETVDTDHFFLYTRGTDGNFYVCNSDNPPRIANFGMSDAINVNNIVTVKLNTRVDFIFTIKEIGNQNYIIEVV